MEAATSRILCIFIMKYHDFKSSAVLIQHASKIDTKLVYYSKREKLVSIKFVVLVSLLDFVSEVFMGLL